MIGYKTKFEGKFVYDLYKHNVQVIYDQQPRHFKKVDQLTKKQFNLSSNEMSKR